MKKNKISKNWLAKQRKDLYFKESKIQGYRSRAVFKLIEMNKKFKFLKRNSLLVALGSSPGSWSQFARKEITKGKILALDILSMKEIDDVKFINGDFLDNSTFEKIRIYFNSKVDVVLSDMAANSSGNKELDTYRTGELCLNAMSLSRKILHNNGVFYQNCSWDLYLKILMKLRKKALKRLLYINLYQAKKNLKKFIFIVKVF